jgi:hypothetical protein
MSWPFKDYDYIGDRYVSIRDSNDDLGEIMWYDRENIHDGKIPTECILCIEAENENYTNYAHPKAHLEAHSEANALAEKMAIKEKETEEYMDYYIFFYGKNYRRIYKQLYKKYKEIYSAIVLERHYEKNDKICNHHQESIQYHFELKKDKEDNTTLNSSLTYEYDGLY